RRARVAHEGRRSGRPRAARRGTPRSQQYELAAELQLVPRGDGSELEQGAAPARVAVAEVRNLLVPGHLEETFLDPVVEPRAAEDELLQPVHEGLTADERDALPVTDEIAPELAARLVDPVSLHQ